MAFSPETKIFTDSGWKPVSDLRGRDRVLVRNFIGEAEFIQPFALKKRTYNGEVVRFGSTYWSVTVTPDHKVVYENETRLAADVSVDKHKFLHRRFRYIREDKTNELLFIKNGDSTRQVSISDDDWYVLVAYTVLKGFISKDPNPRLKYFLTMNNVLPLIEILDKWGVSWSSRTVDKSVVITVNRDNNLPNKLKRFLGARARRDMRLPDKMIYGSSQALMKRFMSTVINLVAKPSKTRPNQLVFTSTNLRLLETIKDMCMFCGYSFSMSEVHGEYIVAIIPGNVSPWSVKFVEKSAYSGEVYEIDLFDGLVYVTERSLPVWMSPK